MVRADPPFSASVLLPDLSPPPSTSKLSARRSLHGDASRSSSGRPTPSSSTGGRTGGRSAGSQYEFQDRCPRSILDMLVRDQRSLPIPETNCSVVQQNFDGIISHGVYFFLLHSSGVADLRFGEKMGSEQGGTLHMKTWSW
uniref:Uncharacterized protein n=1 Tax=Musa acuminata subsp. malaccensis TaxID=214687 RepID=A0A804KY41_MUSAM|nr:PREDICTED: uncharacterized protein LOC103968701 isoform X3 [Musa acuminata subsp. malaccensis]